jgi:uncharacterized protein
MTDFKETPKTKMHRRPDRGTYDRDAVLAILDEAYVCHLSFASDPQSRIIPTVYGRRGDELIVHGAAAAGMIRGLRSGSEACVCVTLVDGFVFARAAFNHAVNYRSVILFGPATEITERADKLDAMGSLVNHTLAGRWDDNRRPSEPELHGTCVLSIPIREASAKIREGGPKDDDKDLDMDLWAGHIPVRWVTDAPIPSPDLKAGVAEPEYVKHYRRPGMK